MYQHRASSFPTHPSQGEITESPGFKCYLQLMIPKLISLAWSSPLNSRLINPKSCVISSLGNHNIILDLLHHKLCSEYHLHQYPMGSALGLTPFQCLRPKSLEPTWLPLSFTPHIQWSANSVGFVCKERYSRIQPPLTILVQSEVSLSSLGPL